MPGTVSGPEVTERRDVALHSSWGNNQGNRNFKHSYVVICDGNVHRVGRGPDRGGSTQISGVLSGSGTSVLKCARKLIR